QISLSEFIEHYRAAALQARIVGGGRCKLLERCFGGLENLAHRLGAHALHVPQALGNVEYEAFSGVLRQLEVPRSVGALPLRARLFLLRNGALLDRQSALPIGDCRETYREHQPGSETAGENVSPSRRSLPAVPDEELGLLSGCRRSSRPRRDPA